MNHMNVSFVKSGLRFVAGGALISGSLLWGGSTATLWGGVFIILAEVLGVLEEVVDKRSDG
jgi:hypothetical protein